MEDVGTFRIRSEDLEKIRIKWEDVGCYCSG